MVTNNKKQLEATDRLCYVQLTCDSYLILLEFNFYFVFSFELEANGGFEMTINTSGKTCIYATCILLTISLCAAQQSISNNSIYEPLVQPQAQVGFDPLNPYGITQSNYNPQTNYNPYSSNTYNSPQSPYANNPYNGVNDIPELSGNPFYDPTKTISSGRDPSLDTTGTNTYNGLGGTYGVSGTSFGLEGIIDENSFCPEFWFAYRGTCYRFIKSPKRNWYDAKKICQAYKAELINVDNIEKHSFILKQLIVEDQKQNRYYVSAKQVSPNSWTNDDGTGLVVVDDGFAYEETDFDSDTLQENLQESNPFYNRYYNRFDPILRRGQISGQNPNQNPSLIPGQNPYDYEKTRLVYGYSRVKERWMFIPVYEFETHLFICESRTLYNPNNINIQQDDQRGFDYGLDIRTEFEKIPRGPYFVNQPNDTIFDTGKRKIRNDVTLMCLAAGYPTPTYSWFKEEYVNDNLTYHLIDPLADSRFTISGGSLIIYDPDQSRDQGTYHCVAENKFGRIRSESVDLNFGYIMEFNLKRSSEAGKSNWGHAMFCDPPQRKCPFIPCHFLNENIYVLPLSPWQITLECSIIGPVISSRISCKKINAYL